MRDQIHNTQESHTDSLTLINLLVAVCVLVAAVYLPVLTARALSFDDGMYVTENGLVQNPSWESIKSFFAEVRSPSTVRGYYQPLTMTSLMIDVAIAGRADDPYPFHRTSLILHVVNTALLTIFLYMLFKNCWVAAGLGLLFGLHPMTVESVAWVAERKTLLATFFVFLSLISYVCFVRSSRKRFYLLCFVAYILALLSKPTALPLPLTMLLIDYWPLNRIKKHALIEKLPFLAIGALFTIITFASQSATALTVSPAMNDLGSVLLILCHNLIFYLQKMFYPVGLSAYYGYPDPIAISTPQYLFGIIGSCIVVLIVIFSLRWTKSLFVGFLIFVTAILPALGIIRFTHTIAADRHAYLPSIGLILIFAHFARKVVNSQTPYPFTGRVVVALFLAIVGAESTGTRRYLSTWQDTIGHYRYMLELCPESPELQLGLGTALASRHCWVEAASHFRMAMEQLPHEPIVHNNLGYALFMGGQTSEAKICLSKAIELDPNQTKAHENLASILMAEGHYIEASRHLSEATRRWKALPIASLMKIAWIRATQPNPKLRDPNEALALAIRAASMIRSPTNKSLEVLAAAYASKGLFDDAIREQKSAVNMAATVQNKTQLFDMQIRLATYQRHQAYIDEKQSKAIQPYPLFQSKEIFHQNEKE